MHSQKFCGKYKIGGSGHTGEGSRQTGNMNTEEPCEIQRSISNTGAGAQRVCHVKKSSSFEILKLDWNNPE